MVLLQELRQDATKVSGGPHVPVCHHDSLLGRAWTLLGVSAPHLEWLTTHLDGQELSGED